jgi:hypothetical protein
MATTFFIVYIKSVASPNYEYDINTMSNIFVQELYACYFTVNLYFVCHLGLYLRKIIFFGSHDLYDVDGRVESNNNIFLYSVYRDFIRFLKKLMLLSHCNGKYSREPSRGSIGITIPI